MKRIQLKRTKGWTMPAGAVKVDRSTAWGNPFRVGPDVSTDNAISAFVADLMRPDKSLFRADAIRSLKGKTLACWCKLCGEHADGKPFWERCIKCAPCHADPLGRLVNPEST